MWVRNYFVIDKLYDELKVKVGLISLCKIHPGSMYDLHLKISKESVIDVRVYDPDLLYIMVYREEGEFLDTSFFHR